MKIAKNKCYLIATMNKMSKEERDRFRDLFQKLDVNKDGRIEIEELSKGLKSLQVPEKDAKGHAQVLILGTSAYCIIAHSPILYHWDSEFAVSWPKIPM